LTSLYSTPVAFPIFNRPELTKKLSLLKLQSQTEKLLVVADGPRQDKQGVKKCAAARAVIEQSGI